MQSSAEELATGASRFGGEGARRVWQLAALEKAVLSSLAENRPIALALEQLALGLEQIAAPGTLGSILILEEPASGRLRHGAAPSLSSSFVAGIDGVGVGPTAGSCGTAAWRSETVIVSDIETDSLWKQYRELAREAGLRACWSVPIFAISGDVLGTFAFYYREPRAPTPEDLVMMEGAARLASIVLERERAERGRARASKRESALFAAARVLAEAEDVRAALGEVVAALGGALSWSAGAVWLRDAVGGRGLTCQACWSVDPERFEGFLDATRARPRAPGEGLPGRVYLSGEPEWMGVADEASGFVRWRAAAAAGLKQGLAFPILAGEEAFGAIELFTSAEGAVDEELLVALRTVGLQVGQFMRRARAQADRQRLIDELRETLRFRELFASILAHDLRNPLNTLLMGTQVLLSGAGPRERQVLGRMQNSGSRMARMIEQLLDLARSRDGSGLALMRERLSLGELATSIVSELMLAYPNARIELQVHGDTVGEWDRDRLGQVISNLVGNAIEHGASGAAVSVRVEGHGPGDVWLVTRNGGTIAPEALPSLFDPFKRAQVAGSRGLGLGLYITKLIVAAHGGTIEVGSDAQETKFEIQLPRAASESAPVARCA